MEATLGVCEVKRDKIARLVARGDSLIISMVLIYKGEVYGLETGFRQFAFET